MERKAVRLTSLSFIVDIVDFVVVKWERRYAIARRLFTKSAREFLAASRFQFWHGISIFFPISQQQNQQCR